MKARFSGVSAAKLKRRTRRGNTIDAFLDVLRYKLYFFYNEADLSAFSGVYPKRSERATSGWLIDKTTNIW